MRLRSDPPGRAAKGAPPLAGWALFVTLGVWLCLAPCSRGADEPPASPAPRPAGPDTTIWVDDAGVPRPLVNVTYDDFLRAWRRAQELGQPDDGPTFNFESFELTGELRGDHAAFAGRLRVRAMGDRRAVAPMGLAGALLEGGAEGLGEDDYLAVSPGGAGYELSLAPGAARDVTFKALIPVQREGALWALRTSFPRAVQSSLKLRLPSPVSGATTSTGWLVDQGSPRVSELDLRGALGITALTWQAGVEPTPAGAEDPVLTVNGAVVARIDGRSVESTATLEVRSFGGGFQRFDVRLPRGATLRPEGEGAPPAVGPAPQIKPLEPATADQGELVSVTLPAPTTGPAAIVLHADQPLGAGEAGREVDLGGFEVLGAARQQGDLVVVVDDDWHAEWRPESGVRRVALADLPAGLQAPEAAAAFHYYRQPWRLPVRVGLQETYVKATPRYRLALGADEARLTVSVAYAIRGAKAPDFRFQLGDWTELTPDPIEPVGLVELSQVWQSHSGELSIPLRQAAARRAEVQFVARRDLSLAGPPLRLRLPTPLGVALNPGELTVVHDDALRVSADVEASAGLQPVAVDPADRDPADPSGQRTLRFRTFLPEVTFAADCGRRPGELTCRVESAITLAPGAVAAEQTLRYEALRQPVERLEFLAPTALAVGGQLALALHPADFPNGPGSEPVPLEWSLGDAPPGGEDCPIAVRLPAPVIGPFIVTATSRVALPSTGGANAGRVTAPLVAPTGLGSSRHEATLVGLGPTAVALPPGALAWTLDDAPSPAGEARFASTLAATKPLEFEVRPAGPAEGNALRVERAWLQTWRRGGAVQQRGVWVVQGDAPVLVLEPVGAPVEAPVEVLVEGLPVSVTRDAEGGLRLALPEARNRERRTVEARYVVPGTSVWSPVTPPAIRPRAEARWADSYWQVVCPSQECLVAGPKGFSACWRPSWRVDRLRRTPSLDADQLAEWSRAAQRPAPGADEHTYLFSTVGAPPAPAATLAPTPWVVLGCSLTPLGLALALWRLAPLRRPAALAAGACIAAAAAAAWPTVALLAAQAGLAGVIAALLGWALHVALLEKPSAPGVPVLAPPTAMADLTQPSGVQIDLGSVHASTDAPTVAAHAGSR